MSQKTIIIIDDDEEDCFFIRYIIEKAFTHYKVVSITDGVKAVRHLTDQSLIPSFVFIDLNMPQLSGLEILTQLKALPHYHQVPVALVTGALDPQLPNEIKALNVVDCIEKTGSYEDMLATLARVLTL